MTSQVSSDENYSQDMIDARVTRLSQTWERMPKKDVTDLIAVVYAYAAASLYFYTLIAHELILGKPMCRPAGQV